MLLDCRGNGGGNRGGTQDLNIRMSIFTALEWICGGGVGDGGRGQRGGAGTPAAQDRHTITICCARTGKLGNEIRRFVYEVRGKRKWKNCVPAFCLK